YMHDVVDRTPEGSHYDVIYFGGGGNGSVVIRHNAMYENLYNQTSVILMESYFGPLKNWTIDNNIMSGGGGTFYCNDAHRGFGAPQNIVLTNNRMGNYRQGFLASINAGGVAVSGNVDINTGVNLDNRI
ncbi:MAG: hypothetical protein QOJ15_5934, partial [Bradyrhizobium sp.]|nr:hypothetical protein [Bradyrhizobium sp.]